MKTIFISIYDGDTEKNILQTDIFPKLKETGNRIVLLIRSAKRIDYYRRNFGGSNVEVELLPQGATTKFENIFNHICKNSIPTYSVFLRSHDAYLRHRNFVRYFFEKILRWLGRFKVWRQFLRWFYYLIPDDYIVELFEKYKPDLVFAPNMFSSEDKRILRQAKKHKIKTVTTVKSWDVLTSKAFTTVICDLILVFNKYNAREAMELGDYPADRIKVIGFPQFDIYNEKSIFLSREEFFRKIGADPTKKLILFAVPGDWKNPYTHEIMIELDKAIDDKRIKEPVQVLARFHPKYPSVGENLKGLKNFIMDRPGTYFSKNQERSIDTDMSKTFAWTFTHDDIIHLANSIFHSDVTINTVSTMTLDAAALDKPIILIGFDGYHQLDYWHSILREYDLTHYTYVLKSGGVRLAKSFEELFNYVNLYLDNPGLDKEGREELRNKLIYKLDGQAGKRVAEYILEILGK